MAFRKKFTRRRKTTQSTAVKALKLAKSLALRDKPEVKINYFESPADQSFTSAAPYFALISDNVTQGPGAQSRTGDILRTVSLSGYVSFARASGSTTAATYIRFIVFRAHKEAGAVIVVTDLLQQGVAQNLVFAPKSKDDMRRFTFLKDVLIRIDPLQKRTVSMKLNLKCPGTTQYTAASTNTEDGGIYMCMLSETATNTPWCNVYTALRFTDV